MKAFVYGIDGGTQAILEAYDMPFFRSLLEDGVVKRTEIDLFSRGWAEIMTGLHGQHTRAFYMAPKLDGTRKFSPSFRMADAAALPGVVPIWKVAERAGYRSGIMNIPTTTPASAVAGFMIGGVGGGLDRVLGYPPGMIFPHELQADLERSAYRADFRAPWASDLVELFNTLNQMERTRAETFTSLAKRENIGFGCLVNRGTSVAQYLAMSEIQRRLETGTPNGGQGHDTLLSQLLEEHFQALDGIIELLWSRLDPTHFVLTADHSMVPFLHRANLSWFLGEHDWLRANRRFPRVRGRIRREAKSRLERWPRSAGRVTDLVDPVFWSRTAAFGHDYIYGIYINDAKRFGGPVREPEVEPLVQDIISAFNGSTEARGHGMSAFPYRARHEGARFSACLPDIYIEKPDTIYVDNAGTTLIRPNPLYRRLESLEGVRVGRVSGQKGRHPLFLADARTAALAEEEDPSDLCLAYRLLERVLLS